MCQLKGEYMKLTKLSLGIIGIVVGLISITGVTYALTSIDFNTRAQSWTAAKCTQALTSSKNNLDNNETATICYNFLVANEQKTAINNQQLSINDLFNRAGIPGPKGDKGDVGPKGDNGPVLLDGNNNVLGTLIGSDGFAFYNQKLNKVVHFTEQNPGYESYDTVGTEITLHYETSDCTGSAYGNRSEPLSTTQLYASPYGGNHYFVIDPNAPILDGTTIRSYKDIRTDTPCMPYDGTVPVSLLTQVDLPFSTPLIKPVHLQ